MATKDLSPIVPGISISGASDEESDPEQLESKSQEKDALQDSDSNDNPELNGSNEECESKKLSELAEKMDDVNIKENEDSLYSSADIVGDRVLVEKDGKFELVDIAEVKAEYFLMKGIDPNFHASKEKDEKPAEEQNMKNEEKKRSNEESKGAHSPRPKTSPIRGNSNRIVSNNRVASAIVTRKHNDEYSYLKSKYGMTEHQLEMKKRREEAIAKRKKEEEEREMEEMERKREEAEKAFQAWLRTKNEEYLEKRRSLKSSKNQGESEKDEAAKKAYDLWLNEKAKQRKQERELEKRKLEEEASSFVIRERQACEEAFKKWLKEKRVKEKSKLAERRTKKHRRKGKAFKKEAAPINSTSIRFTDYYGYSHTVAL